MEREALLALRDYGTSGSTCSKFIKFHLLSLGTEEVRVGYPWVSCIMVSHALEGGRH
jgi:hypothetical protein